MKIFSSKVIKDLDAATCEAQGIDSLTLMDRAANAVVKEIRSRRFLPSSRFVVFAGPGNNGGDALAVARLLAEAGYENIEVYLFNVRGQLSEECEAQKQKLIEDEVKVKFNEITRSFVPPHLIPTDIIIDGLFGVGLHDPLTEGFAAVARLINESGAYVISIDIPSGLAAEWNANFLFHNMVHANLTLTFQFPKLSFFFNENADIIGELVVLDIGIDRKALKNMPSEWLYIEGRTIHKLLRQRNPFSAKRDYGSVMMFAGSLGMMGAAVLSAKAALKSGAGLVTVHAPRTGLVILQTAVPEAMFEPDRNERVISDMSLHHTHQAVAVGPGLGTNDLTVNALEALLKTCKSPMVLDADALNCIVKRPSLLSMLPPRTIITPHIGEFDRLFGDQPSSEQRLKKAIEVSKHYEIIIVLKGHYTMIVRPNGTQYVYFNSTGNAGMATAGAGDVLTGVIASFLAQGIQPENAAALGVFIHGKAGDIASEEIGEYGVIASDISDRLGRAIKDVIDHNRKN
ncbi:MAG: NAD(P)H-hydrate dehydratase [Muribaculaceae bacterium]|nr:NAD(P)H-hydrate dehydratase [Muribaculaceae bacterium]